MQFPNKQKLEALRAKYPAGTKIILHRMNDPYPVPSGTIGEVEYIDDGGNIHMVWNNGRTLSLIEGVDDFSKATGGVRVSGGHLCRRQKHRPKRQLRPEK